MSSASTGVASGSNQQNSNTAYSGTSTYNFAGSSNMPPGNHSAGGHSSIGVASGGGGSSLSVSVGSANFVSNGSFASSALDDFLCPICCEDIAAVDVHFFPCPCGYQLCRFCWTRIRDNMEPLCPACRRPYDDESVRFTPVSHDQVVKINAERKRKTKAANPPSAVARARTTSNVERGNLRDLKVTVPTLVYVNHIPQRIANEELLKSEAYFGQFGRILKLVISRKHSNINASSNLNTASGSVISNSGGGLLSTTSANVTTPLTGVPGQHSSYPSSSTSSSAAAVPPDGQVAAYITYTSRQEAAAAIAYVDGSHVDNRILRATFGTTRYCSAWIQNRTCANQNCVYLHELVRDSVGDDSCSSAVAAAAAAVRTRFPGFRYFGPRGPTAQISTPTQHQVSLLSAKASSDHHHQSNSGDQYFDTNTSATGNSSGSVFVAAVTPVTISTSDTGTIISGQGAWGSKKRLIQAGLKTQVNSIPTHPVTESVNSTVSATASVQTFADAVRLRNSVSEANDDDNDNDNENDDDNERSTSRNSLHAQHSQHPHSGKQKLDAEAAKPATKYAKRNRSGSAESNNQTASHADALETAPVPVAEEINDQPSSDANILSNFELLGLPSIDAIRSIFSKAKPHMCAKLIDALRLCAAASSSMEPPSTNVVLSAMAPRGPPRHYRGRFDPFNPLFMCPKDLEAFIARSSAYAAASAAAAAAAAAAGSSGGPPMTSLATPLHQQFYTPPATQLHPQHHIVPQNPLHQSNLAMHQFSNMPPALQLQMQMQMQQMPIQMSTSMPLRNLANQAQLQHQMYSPNQHMMPAHIAALQAQYYTRQQHQHAHHHYQPTQPDNLLLHQNEQYSDFSAAMPQMSYQMPLHQQRQQQQQQQLHQQQNQQQYFSLQQQMQQRANPSNGRPTISLPPREIGNVPAAQLLQYQARQRAMLNPMHQQMNTSGYVPPHLIPPHLLDGTNSVSAISRELPLIPEQFQDSSIAQDVLMQVASSNGNSNSNNGSNGGGNKISVD